MDERPRQRSVQAVSAAPRPPALVRALVYATVAYVVLATADLKIAAIPLKLFLVVPALAWWGLAVGPRRRRGEFAFAAPVLVVAVLVPLFWFAVAAWLRHNGDPAQPRSLGFAVREASRFVYLLLYFPVVAEMRRRPRWRGAGIWLAPAVVLCLVTWGLYLGHAVFGADYGYSGTVGPFQGAVGLDGTGTLRVFLIDDIVFLAAFAFLVADLLERGLRRANAALAVLLLGAAFLAHSRGLWAGFLAVIAVVIACSWPRARLTRLRRVALAVTALAGIAALLLSADPALARSVILRLTGARELSTGLRLAQAPELLRGFARHPLLGSGLGATLPSGYARSSTDPWSFELTYLQLLFQLGAAGTALVALPVAAALACAWRLAGRGRGPDRIRALAGLGVAGGFLLSAAGSPYLLTSAGMLTLGVVLALVETAAHGPGGEPSTAPGPRRGLRALASPRPAFALLVVWVALLVVTEFARGRVSTGAAPAADHARVRR